MEEKLEIDLTLMRKKERVVLAHELYHIGAWLQCCKVVKDSNLIEHTVNSRYESMVLLYGSAALQNISNNKNEQIQNEYLKDALSEITHYQKENPYIKKKKMTILRGYLVEKLYDKNQLDFVTLVNEYMTLQQQSAESLKDEATLSYVKLLLLVHLIHDSSDDSQFKTFIAESKELFKKITPLSELDETKAILQAWVANQTNKKNIQEYLKKAHTQLSDVNKHVNYLPKPVREFAKTFLAED